MIMSLDWLGSLVENYCWEEASLSICTNTDAPPYQAQRNGRTWMDGVNQQQSNLKILTEVQIVGIWN